MKLKGIVAATLAAVMSFAMPGVVEHDAVQANSSADMPEKWEGEAVFLTERNFPDEVFRKYVADNIDTDKSGWLSAEEINKILTIDVDNTLVADLTGIGFFYNLRALDCHGCLDLDKLDIRNNRALKEVKMHDTNISIIDLGTNPYLASAYKNGTKSGVAYHVRYSEYNVGIRQTVSIELEDEVKVKTEKYGDLGTWIYDIRTFPDDCLRDYVRGFDVDGDGYISKAEAEDVLYVYYRGNVTAPGMIEPHKIVSTKGLEIFTNLRSIDLGSNRILDIDVSSFPDLSDLEISFNYVSEIDLRYNPKLKNLNLTSNILSSLDLSNNPKLWELFCNYNELTSLDLSKNTALAYAAAADNDIESVKLPESGSLHNLSLGWNKLESIDLSVISKAENISLEGNPLESVDIRSLPKITDAYLNGTVATSKSTNMVHPDEYLIYTSDKLPHSYLSVSPDTKVVAAEYEIKVQSSPSDAGKVTGAGKYLNTDKVTVEATADKGYAFVSWSVDEKTVSDSAKYEFEPSKDVTLVANFATATPIPTVTPTTKPTSAPTEKVTATPTAKPTIVPSEDPKTQILAFVERIYTYVLNREPEAEGATFWSDELYAFRRTGAEVAQGFIFSPEFEARNTSDNEFVTILYKTFFGRDPEEEGMNFWLGQLSSGTMDRVAVANGFIYSQEWANTCAEYGIRSGGDIKPTGKISPTDLTYAFVERMYTTAMGRGYDEEGRQYWASELANFNITGEQVGVSFFLSDEMVNYKLSDKDYLGRLYATFMNREPDADGESYWLSQMGSGVSRVEIVLGFTRSPEFTEKCVEARILPY